MIFRDFTTTGDGIISALQILRIMQETGKPLSELKRCLKKYPQAQRNLRVKRKAAAGGVAGGDETGGRSRTANLPGKAASFCVTPAPNRKSVC